MGAKVRLVAKTHEPVSCDTGAKVVPDSTFQDAPKSPDMILIPGGTLGTLTAMQDPETIAFVKAVGTNARFVSSVCTGSLVLGAAGFLKGKKATSHWIVRDMLRHFGAIPTAERVVSDGNILTAAGVTAGLDLGMYVATKWRDQEYSDCLSLLAEYAPPRDPHDVPARASQLARQKVGRMFVDFKSKVESACRGQSVK
jgi:cyclohexyl-isocyanide hydratase